MAETSVLSISLKEYKKSIEDLRSSLLGLENGSEEYNKIVEEIRERQQTLNDVMRAGKAEYDSNANSLNGMKARLSELKKEFGDLEVGTEKWKKAQSEIESLNEDIGKIEQGMGIFSRNVGNYSSAFVGAINSMGGSVGNLIPVISGLKQGFIALQKVPIVAVIAAIAMALQQLGKAFTSSNENAHGLAKAFAPLKAVGDMVTRVFEGIASKLIDLFKPIANIISNTLNATTLFIKCGIEGNVETARAYFMTGKNRVLYHLIEQRFSWMNEFINQSDQIVIELGCGAGLSKFFIHTPNLILTDVDEHP